MFADVYDAVLQKVSELAAAARVEPVDNAVPNFDAMQKAEELARWFWASGFGSGGDLDRAILSRSAEIKRALYAGRVYHVVPIYVSSICVEQCAYCNYRAGNKGVGVERRRLDDQELLQECRWLIEEKGFRVLELVYASDPRVKAADICRHVELVRNLLEQYGGGTVGLSAEPLEESDYRSLVSAGLAFSVIWQETYDKDRYRVLHPGKTKKTDFDYRVNAYDRMLTAGLSHIGMGVLTGLADWKRDWAFLMLHQEYLRERYGRGADILGTPRMKHAPGAVLHQTGFEPTDQQFLLALALQNIFSPRTAAFVSTREGWDICTQMARGGGCLFTLNCSTIPGGYSLGIHGRQFTAHSFDAPVYAAKLRELGFEPTFTWELQEWGVAAV